MNNKKGEVDFSQEEWEEYGGEVREMAMKMLRKNPKKRIELGELQVSPKLQNVQVMELQSPGSVRKMMELENESRNLNSLVWVWEWGCYSLKSSKYSGFYGSNRSIVLDELNDDEQYASISAANLEFLEVSWQVFNR